MKKLLSVVFPICSEGDKKYILMGIQASGKKLAGFRNGYGGKCEDGETTTACAVRELEEELKLSENYEIKISLMDLQKAGTIFMDEKQIDVFVLNLKEKIVEPTDNSEFVDTKWFDLDHPEEFVPEMLSGDDAIISALKTFLETGENFEINKSENNILRGQVKKIYK